MDDDTPRPLTPEQFILRFIDTFRDPGKSRGIHTVYSGFNAVFRQYSPALNPVEVTKELAEAARLKYASSGAEPCSTSRVRRLPLPIRRASYEGWALSDHPAAGGASSNVAAPSSQLDGPPIGIETQRFRLGPARALLVEPVGCQYSIRICRARSPSRSCAW